MSLHNAERVGVYDAFPAWQSRWGSASRGHVTGKNLHGAVGVLGTTVRSV